MGTLLNRRRYMGGGGAPVPTDYIQDGLVFWLDGIDKGPNEGYWTDLKGGCQYSYPASGTTVLDKGVEFTSQVTMHLASGTVPNNSGYTIEVCFVKSGGGSPTGIFSIESGATSGSIAVAINNNKNMFMQRQKCILENPTLDSLSMYSYNLDVCCVNGNQGTFTGTDYWSVGQNNVGVGAIYGTRGIIGIIHSIRIYNRKLSLLEMKHNQSIDSQRFGT